MRNPYPFYEIRQLDSGSSLFINKSENLSFPMHFHHELEFVLVLEGSVGVTVNQQTKLLKQNEMAFIFPNEIHGYQTTETSLCLLVIFKPELIKDYFIGKEGKTLSNPFLQCEQNISTLLDQVWEARLHHENEYILKGLLYLIFGRLNSNFTFGNNCYLPDETIHSLLKYIENHCTDSITLDSTADYLGFSKSYVSKLFNEKIGCTFSDYVNQLRLNRFLSLSGEQDKIVNLALGCGFDSIRNFNRIFKQYYQVTPSEYRKQIKK